MNDANSVPVIPEMLYFIAVDGVLGATGVVNLNYSLQVPAWLTVLASSPEGYNQLRLAGQVDAEYQIHFSTNLVDWTVLTTTNAPTGTFDFIHVGSGAYSQGFYRALTMP